jgi:hypothetical protein
VDVRIRVYGNSEGGIFTTSKEKEIDRMITRLTDRLLAILQRRCPHPDNMCAIDILEGVGRDIEIGYCNRCGAVKIKYSHQLNPDWRTPDPNLWRGK